MTEITRQEILDNWCNVMDEVTKDWVKNGLNVGGENEDGDLLVDVALEKVGFFKYQGTEDEKENLFEEMRLKDLETDRG